MAKNDREDVALQDSIERFLAAEDYAAALNIAIDAQTHASHDGARAWRAVFAGISSLGTISASQTDVNVFIFPFVILGAV